MILVCEPICWGSEHVPFNAALLEIIRLAAPSESVLFCGEQSHLKQVAKQINPERASSISWKPLSLPARFTALSHRYLHDFKLIRQLLKAFNRNSTTQLVLSSTTSSTLQALKLLTAHSRMRRDHPQVFLHSNLSQLNYLRSRNPLARIQELRTALTIFKDSRVRYVVLEEPIKEAMLKKIPSLAGKVDAIDHPIPANELVFEEMALQPSLRFGFLGLASEEKGFPLFLQLASEMTVRYPGRVEFHSIGMISHEHGKLQMKALMTKPSQQKLDRGEFISRLKDLHYVCFPYQKRHYELCASGVLLDAIAWEKPFIAMDVPIFQNLFSRFESPGYLCGNKDEFTSLVKRLIERPDTDKYKAQIASLRKIKQSRTPEVLASKYRELYEKGQTVG